MNDQEIIELLGRGGVAGDPLVDPPAKYDPLADPAAAEQLGVALAERVRAAVQPTSVLVWEDPEDVVLGHIVARELGLSVIRAYDADGLVGHRTELPEGASIVLVADAVRDPVVIRAIRSVAERRGGSLVATAVLIETAVLRSVGTDAGSVIALTRTVDPQSEAA